MPALSYKIKSDDQLYGEYLHELLSKITEDAEIDKTIAAIQLKFNIGSKNIVEKLKQDASNALKLLNSYHLNGSTYSIKNESSIYYEGEVLRPDRVLMKDNTAIIIDFKTGLVEDDHQKQVKKYCKVVSEMGFNEVKGYLLYTETNSLQEVQLN